VQGPVVSLCTVLSYHLPGETQENHENPQTGYSVPRPRLESHFRNTSQERDRLVMHLLHPYSLLGNFQHSGGTCFREESRRQKPEFLLP
jgi:hypothetical protein